MDGPQAPEQRIRHGDNVWLAAELRWSRVHLFGAADLAAGTKAPGRVQARNGSDEEFSDARKDAIWTPS